MFTGSAFGVQLTPLQQTMQQQKTIPSNLPSSGCAGDSIRGDSLETIAKIIALVAEKYATINSQINPLIFTL